MADADSTALRRCSRCGEDKPATREFFSPVPRVAIGLARRCKKCACEVQKERYKDPAVKLARKLWKRKDYRANPEKHREQSRRWIANNPDKVREIKKRDYAKNAEEQKRKALEWQRANPERARARKRAYKKSAKGRANANKPANRLRKSCSDAVRRMLKGHKPNGAWTSTVDYTMPELMDHLERQFTRGMTWDNYGKWHIDHIIPLASFEITDAECDDFHRAFALANLRPLWGKDNMKKSAKLVTLL